MPYSEEILIDLESNFEGSIINLSISDCISKKRIKEGSVDESLAPAIGGELRL
jgi:hypothetical protein